MSKRPADEAIDHPEKDVKRPRLEIDSSVSDGGLVMKKTGLTGQKTSDDVIDLTGHDPDDTSVRQARTNTDLQSDQGLWRDESGRLHETSWDTTELESGNAIGGVWHSKLKQELRYAVGWAKPLAWQEYTKSTDKVDYAKRLFHPEKKEYYYIPMNQDKHWTLALIFNAAALLQPENEPMEHWRATIAIFDSLKRVSSAQQAEEVKIMLLSILPQTAQENEIVIKIMDPPKQTDAFNCGVHLLRNMQMFISYRFLFINDWKSLSTSDALGCVSELFGAEQSTESFREHLHATLTEMDSKKDQLQRQHPVASLFGRSPPPVPTVQSSPNQLRLSTRQFCSNFHVYDLVEGSLSSDNTEEVIKCFLLLSQGYTVIPPLKGERTPADAKWARNALVKYSTEAKKPKSNMTKYGSYPEQAEFLRKKVCDLVAQLDELRKGVKGDQAYGEILSGLYQFFDRASPDCHTFIDLGCGIGNLLVEASLLRPTWDITGFEVRSELKKYSEQLQEKAAGLAKEWHLPIPKYTIEFKNIIHICDSPNPPWALTNGGPVLVFANSVSWTHVGLNGTLFRLVQQMAVDSVLVCTQKIDFGYLEREEIVFKADQLSWTNKPVTFYVHRKIEDAPP